jgi:DNA-binding MarR family transcriptional regulator
VSAWSGGLSPVIWGDRTNWRLFWYSGGNEMVKVWCLIPPSVYYDKDVSEAAKTLYGRLLGLVNETGYCWAGDNFLAEDRGVDVRTIQRHLRELKKEGYIEIETSGKTRFIRLKLNKHDKTVVSGTTKLSDIDVNIVDTPVTESVTGKIPKENNKDLELDLAIREVFDFWVKARYRVLTARGQLDTGRKQPTMKLTTGKNSRREAISARLNEGYTTEALKRAVLGCLGNDFNVENGHIDIGLICRSSAKVEQYIAWFNKRKRESKKGPEVWNG